MSCSGFSKTRKSSNRNVFVFELEDGDPRFFGITVQALDLGTSEDLDQIVMNPDVLKLMDNSEWDEIPGVPNRIVERKKDTSASLNPFLADPEAVEIT